MPTLIMDAVNVNDLKTVRALLAGFNQFIHEPEHYLPLRIKNGAYFSTSPNTLPTEAGWYVIIAGKRPLYVGEADSLDGRLNSDNGCRDNFLNSQRKTDPERNFIKKLSDSKFFPDLTVWFVTERDLSNRVEIKMPLSSLDRCNIEKILNICRGELQEWMMSRSCSSKDRSIQSGI
jgi:hypothetical protein